MIVKKYLANSLGDAVELIKLELGAQHMILTTRNVQKKGLFGWLSSSQVEVTAAIDEADLRAHNERKRGSGQKKRVQKDQGEGLGNLSQNLEDLKRMVDQEQKPAPAMAVVKNKKVETATTYGDPRLKQQRSVEEPKKMPQPSMPAPSGAAREIENATSNLMKEFGHLRSEPEPKPNVPEPQPTRKEESGTADRLRKVIREEMLRAQKGVSVGSLRQNDEETVGSVRFLMAKGLSRAKALGIEERLNQQFGPVDLKQPSSDRASRLNALKNELRDAIQTTGPITLKQGQPTYVAMIGPTGVGKTTTLAKIAGKYTRQLNKKVGIISLDTTKMGAREQIRAVADTLKVPVQIVESPSQLPGAMEAFKGQDLVLIDTGGRSQYKKAEVDTLADLMEMDGRIQNYLVVSATTKDVDVFGIVKQFSRIPLKGLIFTKLDETIAYGMMVNVCDKTGLPLSYLTTGQQVPEDIKVADADEIAKSILMQHNDAAAESLRRMVGT